jgi:peroxiredoxin Q/BCP
MINTMHHTHGECGRENRECLKIQKENLMKMFLKLLLVSALLASGSSSFAENPTNFSLKSALDDSKFELSEHRGKTVVLHFLLKTECPLCLRYTREYAVLAATTPDVLHVFLKPDSVDEIKSWVSHLDQKELSAVPMIYRDPDAKLAKQFDIPDGYAFHGQKVHYPALVALNKEGKEIFRYVGKSNRDRMSVDAFKAKLEATK